VLLRGVSVVGACWPTFAEIEPGKHDANLELLFACCESGEIKAHSGTEYPFLDAPTAIGRADGRGTTGRAIVTACLGLPAIPERRPVAAARII
jgi:hypothetical protein